MTTNERSETMTTNETTTNETGVAERAAVVAERLYQDALGQSRYVARNCSPEALARGLPLLAERMSNSLLLHREWMAEREEALVKSWATNGGE